MDAVAKQERSFLQELFQQAALAKQLPAPLVEKDFWVCWTLKRLFTIPEFDGHLIFKGGTTLSKVHNIIQRFSEDIDLTLDRRLFGYGDKLNPDAATSNKRRKKLSREMGKACAAYIQGEFSELLRTAITKQIGESGWTLETDPEVNDGQSLLFRYPKTVEVSQYVRPAVKIELGSRSDFWPADQTEIRSYAAEGFPGPFDEPLVDVVTLKAERTFWEKVTILHAEYFRPADRDMPGRYSRHYYDTAMLADTDICERALEDLSLLARVVEHKQLFFKRSWSAYDAAKPPTLHLMPPEWRAEALTADYEQMKEMMFADPPPFDDLLATISELEAEINALV